MTTPHITARRTLVALDPVWLEPVVDALAHAAPLEPAPSMSPGTRRLAEFLTQHNGDDPRFARLGPTPKPVDVSDPLAFPRAGGVPHAAFWQFDYPDMTHGHVAVSSEYAPNWFPVGSSQDIYICCTSSRHYRVTLDDAGRTATRSGDAWLLDPDVLADYIAGARHTIGPHTTIDPDLLSSVATVRTQSGPPLRDAAWGTNLPAPGTDLAFDMTAGGGLHAVYRVYPKKRTNQ